MTDAHSYAFKVGTMDCVVLLDGTLMQGVQGILKRFPEVSEAECRRAYAEAGFSLDEAEIAFNILVAKVGSETILVDSGEGGKPHGGKLIESLSLAGITPQAITRVVITHAHGDHVLGLISDQQQAVFPNATYFISRPEMAFWKERVAGAAADQATIIRMIEDRGLTLIETDAHILPGVQAVPLPGHTPGQIGLLFESGGESLLHLADMAHMPMQFGHPDWSPSFDGDKAQAAETRVRNLGRAADQSLLILLYHMPFPGLGRIKRTDKAFVWTAAG
jgi:glyoxylase-like metal-dependent hydrolase (beta-lactamase superfamily II)